ncbi:MAG TPA: response regulator, partial [Polyangiaceae bacterium]
PVGDHGGGQSGSASSTERGTAADASALAGADASSPAAEPHESAPGPQEQSNNYLRVSTERLDALANHLDELLRLRGAWGKHVESLTEVARGHDTDEATGRMLRHALTSGRAAHSAMARVVDDLTLEIHKIRTVALSTIAPQWRRVVREAAETLGKKVRLTLDVGDTAVDKRVLEHIRDPIVHVLRNAVDHGVEPWQERHLLGKPDAGSVSIVARMSGGGVAIEIRDDGKGSIADEVAKAAVERGIVSKEASERMTSQEKLDLLFLDGFSTAKELSSISGRGVGLAAVREELASVGGTCTLSSAGSGMGTCFRFEVPVSVLATTGLLVKVDGTVYMLPTIYVERALRVNRSEVRSFNGFPVLEGNDPEPIAVLALRDDDPRIRDVHGHLDVVVLDCAGERMALVVDEVLEQQECVTRRLPWNIRRIQGMHGVVVLDDGSLAIALEIGFLLRKRFLNTATTPSQAGRSRLTSTSLRILVVDDSLTQRTLQRNILTSAGYAVEVAVDGVEAWDKLRQKQFDLLLSDIEMPGMDGLELTRRIRTDPLRKGLPIVLVTSRGRESDIQAGAAAGADEYLVKGQFDHDKLLLAVERHLYGRGERWRKK